MPTDPASTSQGVLGTDTWQPCNNGTGVALFSVQGADHSLGAVTVGGVAPMARLWSFLASHFPTAPAPLQARILSAKPVRPATKQPTLVVRVSVNKQVSARLRLTRGSRSRRRPPRPGRPARDRRACRFDRPGRTGAIS